METYVFFFWKALLKLLLGHPLLTCFLNEAQDTQIEYVPEP